MGGTEYSKLRLAGDLTRCNVPPLSRYGRLREHCLLATLPSFALSFACRGKHGSKLSKVIRSTHDADPILPNGTKDEAHVLLLEERDLRTDYEYRVHHAEWYD
nr:hypothetical protein CFP56_11585 [Quercus suber]